MSGTKNSLKPNSQNQWWPLLCKELVMASGAKHCQQMGNALWLFLYLILKTDAAKGILVKKVETIESDMGINQRTIRRWLKILKEGKYIKTTLTGRSLIIHIKLWKTPLDRPDMDSQGAQSLPIRSDKSCQSEKDPQNKDFPCLSQKSPRPDKSGNASIDISINKDIYNIDIDNKKNFKSDVKAFKGFKPKTREELLAFDLAKGLDDLQGLPLYLSYSKKYPEGLLRKILSEIQKIPAEKIKKSRGALFNYLVQKHGKESN